MSHSGGGDNVPPPGNPLNTQVVAIATVSGNDSFLPQPFKGHADESSDDFLNQYEQYVKFKHLNDAAQCELLPLLLKGQAYEWYRGLSADNTNTYDALKTAFEARFKPSAKTKWQRIDSLWERKQHSNETVDEFVSEMRKLARNARLSDDLLREAIIKNFRLDIRRFVVQSKDDTIEDIITAARTAELVEAPASGDNTWTQIAREMKESQIQMQQEVRALSNKMDKMSVSQIAPRDTRSPGRSASPSPARHVSFDDERRGSRNNQDRRQPDYHTEGGNWRQQRDGGRGRWNYNRGGRGGNWRGGRPGSAPSGNYNTHGQRGQSYYRGQNTQNRWANVQCHLCGFFGHKAVSCDKAYAMRMQSQQSMQSAPQMSAQSAPPGNFYNSQY
jgi:hypothetical protein